MEKFDEPTTRLNDINTDSGIEEKLFGVPQMLISAVAVREMRGEEPLSDTYTYFLPDGVLICKVRAGAWVRASVGECVRVGECINACVNGGMKEERVMEKHTQRKSRVLEICWAFRKWAKQTNRLKKNELRDRRESKDEKERETEGEKDSTT